MGYCTAFPNYKIDMIKLTHDELGILIIISTTYNLITQSPQ
jgi:hypothetical protein